MRYLVLLLLVTSCSTLQYGVNVTNVYVPDVGHTQTVGPYLGAPVGPVYTYGVYGVNNGTVTVGANIPIGKIKFNEKWQRRKKDSVRLRSGKY